MRMRAGSFCRCSLNMLLYILHLLDVLMLWSPSKKRWRTLHILHSWKLSSATKQENVNVIIIASFRSCSDTFGKQLFSLLIWLHACECLLSKSSFVLCNIFHFSQDTLPRYTIQCGYFCSILTHVGHVTITSCYIYSLSSSFLFLQHPISAFFFPQLFFSMKQVNIPFHDRNVVNVGACLSWLA